ncbi:hypothetical protein [Bifidobacterium leontopitheci]|uniref:hypothetical protein n=1 Tax=Bifidobacterium leontopitheci TaxID=2650774 RepID=UPI00186AD0D6|nr:hypothetical protein [Bifidobacterium leontopitheci]
MPLLQYVFVNPDNPREWYRSDFVWIFPGGYTVVLEFDGMAKYVDPTMTDGRTIRAVVSSQSERERVIYACGADRIVRATFEEALQRKPLVDKLVGAGLPRNPRTETGAPPAIPFLVAGQQWDERLRQSWMRSFHAAS